MKLSVEDIVRLFKKYLENIKRNSGDKIRVLEVSGYSIDSRQYHDFITITILYDYNVQYSEVKEIIEETMEKIYKFKKNLKIFPIPERVEIVFDFQHSLFFNRK